MRTSEKAWLGLAAGVTAYEILAPEGELLSEQVDRWLDSPRTRFLAIGAVAVTAAHLLNLFERLGIEDYDPYAKLARLKTRCS